MRNDISEHSKNRAYKLSFWLISLSSYGLNNITCWLQNSRYKVIHALVFCILFFTACLVLLRSIFFLCFTCWPFLLIIFQTVGLFFTWFRCSVFFLCIYFFDRPFDVFIFYQAGQLFSLVLYFKCAAYCFRRCPL